MRNIKVDLCKIINQQAFASDKHTNAHLAGNLWAFVGFRRLGEEKKGGRQQEQT